MNTLQFIKICDFKYDFNELNFENDYLKFLMQIQTLRFLVVYLVIKLDMYFINTTFKL